MTGASNRGRRGVGRSTREWAGAMDQWVRHMLTRISSYCMHLHCARTPLRCALHASHVVGTEIFQALTPCAKLVATSTSSRS